MSYYGHTMGVGLPPTYSPSTVAFGSTCIHRENQYVVLNANGHQQKQTKTKLEVSYKTTLFKKQIISSTVK